MGRRHDTHVGLAVDATADAPHAPALERAQQAWLQIERQLGHLVQKERASLRSLEGPRMGRDGAREGSALVPEELALREVGGHRAAVEDDERAPRAGAAFVQRAGEHVLAGAGLSDQRHGDVGPRDAFEHVEDLVHRRRASDDLSETAKGRRVADRGRGQRGRDSPASQPDP